MYLLLSSALVGILVGILVNWCKMTRNGKFHVLGDDYPRGQITTAVRPLSVPSRSQLFGHMVKLNGYIYWVYTS